MSEQEWRRRYIERINSEEWKALKRRLVVLRGPICARCRRIGPLDMHHKTYERLGEEDDDDLELVCRSCHPIADEERAAEGRRRSEQARYEAGLNTYATKKYGEDWEWTQDPDEVAEEFDEWLENR